MFVYWLFVCTRQAEYCIDTATTCKSAHASATVVTSLAGITGLAKDDKIWVYSAVVVETSFTTEVTFGTDASASGTILTFKDVTSVKFDTAKILINNLYTIVNTEMVLLEIKKDTKLKVSGNVNSFASSELKADILGNIEIDTTDKAPDGASPQITFKDPTTVFSVKFPFGSNMYEFFTGTAKKVKLEIPSFYCIGKDCTVDETDDPVFKTYENLETFDWASIKFETKVVANKLITVDASATSIKKISLGQEAGKTITVDGVQKLNFADADQLLVNDDITLLCNEVELNVVAKLIELSGTADYGDAASKCKMILTSDLLINTGTDAVTDTKKISFDTKGTGNIKVTFSFGSKYNTKFESANSKVTFDVATAYCIGEKDSCKPIADLTYWYLSIEEFETVKPSEIYIGQELTLKLDEIPSGVTKIHQAKDKTLTINGAEEIELDKNGLKVGTTFLYEGKFIINISENVKLFKYTQTNIPDKFSTTEGSNNLFIIVKFNSEYVKSNFVFTNKDPKKNLLKFEGIDKKTKIRYISTTEETDMTTCQENFEKIKCEIGKQTIVKICSTEADMNVKATITGGNTDCKGTWDLADVKSTDAVSIYLKKIAISLKDIRDVDITLMDTDGDVVNELTIGSVSNINFVSPTDVSVGQNNLIKSESNNYAKKITIQLDYSSGKPILFAGKTGVTYSKVELFLEISDSLIRVNYIDILGTITGPKYTLKAPTTSATVVVSNPGTHQNMIIGTSVTIVVDEESFYCIAEDPDTKCKPTNALLTWVVVNKYNSWPDPKDFNSEKAKIIKTNLLENQIDLSQFLGKFTVTYLPDAGATGSVKPKINVKNVAKISGVASDSTQFDVSGGESNNGILTLGDSFKELNITCKSEVEFDVQYALPTGSKIILGEAVSKLKGVIKNNKIYGNGIYDKSKLSADSDATFGPYLKTEDEEAKLRYILLCNYDEVNCKKDSKIEDISETNTLMADTSYSPRPDSDRKKLTFYIYHALYKDSESANLGNFKIKVDEFYSEKVIIFDKPTVSSRLLTADPITITEIIFSNPTTLETSDTGMNLFSNERKIDVNLLNARTAGSVLLGERLNIKSSSSKSEIPNIKLILSKPKTTIAFDSIKPDGSKFTVSSEVENPEVAVYSGSSSVDDLSKVLTVGDSIKSTFSEGSPEDKPSSPKTGLSGGAIAGIVIGCVAFVGIIVGVVVFVVMKKKKAAKVNCSQA